MPVVCNLRYIQLCCYVILRLMPFILILRYFDKEMYMSKKDTEGIPNNNMMVSFSKLASLNNFLLQIKPQQIKHKVNR